MSDLKDDSKVIRLNRQSKSYTTIGNKVVVVGPAIVWQKPQPETVGEALRDAGGLLREIVVSPFEDLKEA